MHCPCTRRASSLSRTCPARLAHMDRLGVDVQVVFSTFFIGRTSHGRSSKPRWRGAGTAGWPRSTARAAAASSWVLRAPVRTMERAFEEMEFGKEHGAVGGAPPGADGEHGPRRRVLPPAVREGAGPRPGHVRPRRPRPARLLPSRPSLRVRDRDGGPTRLPSVVCQRSARAFPAAAVGLDGGGGELGAPSSSTRRRGSNEKSGMMRGLTGRGSTSELMARNSLFVACQMDDDIPYLVRYAGEGNLVMGTDYGHLDVGSDLYAGGIVAERADLDPRVVQKIVDDNAARALRHRPELQAGTRAEPHRHAVDELRRIGSGRRSGPGGVAGRVGAGRDGGSGAARGRGDRRRAASSGWARISGSISRRSICRVWC